MDFEYKLFAYHIVKKLQDAGHVALYAGGCVRDELLGVPIKDIDVTTSATPEQVKELFQKQFQIVAVGESFGVVRILTDTYGNELGGYHVVEVATFRKDGGYSDGRRPDSVEFVKDITEDLARRDLTINAIAYNPVTGVYYDPYNGKKDIELKVIRTVGDANDRFGEDYLRMLRAIRFACRLEFNMNWETFGAIKKNANKIKTVSSERIAKELLEIFAGNSPGMGFKLLMFSGLMKEIMPEILASYKYGDIPDCQVILENGPWDNAVDTFDALPTNNPRAAIALLLFAHYMEHDLDKTEEVLRRLNFASAGVDNRKVLAILNTWLDVLEIHRKSKLEQYHLISNSCFYDCIDLILAISRHRKDELLQIYTNLGSYFKYESPLKIGERPIIDGEFILDTLKCVPGKYIGILIEKGMEAQLAGKFIDKNTAKIWLKDVTI